MIPWFLVALTEVACWHSLGGQLDLGNPRRLHAPGLASGLVLIVNFLYQFGWAICPDIWSNIISDVYEGVFLDDINI